jgi:acetyl esterase/lipase
MKSKLFLIIVLLCFFACKRNNPAEEVLHGELASSSKETPMVFIGSLGTDDYAVFVEHNDGKNIEGHLLPLQGMMSDSVAFQMKTSRLIPALYYHGRKKAFRLSDVTVENDSIMGVALWGFFKSANFCFSKMDLPTFQFYDDRRYHDSLFAVEKISDIQFAQAMGYWTEMDNETSVSNKIFKMGSAMNERPLDLKLDLYVPQDDTLQKRPFVMLVHGGAFYFGSKDDKSITQWCRHLASMGYVAASIDYRIGFLPTKVGIGRAGYRAVQDAHAAMRFLVAHSEDYGIDTAMMFVGGCSAGAITVLNLAYMTSETRPDYTYKHLLHPDLGAIDTCGNDIRTNFTIKGIVDMWGAVADTSMMQGHKEPVIAFHGDADDVVPFGYGYPFRVAGAVKSMLVDKMYGSSCIVDHAAQLGINAQLVNFEGYKHAPQLDPATNALNDNFYLIQDKMSDFFYNIINPETPEIVEEGRRFYVRPEPDQVSWQVEGGVVVSSEDEGVEVVWIRNAPKHRITVSATMPNGTGFNKTIIR